MLTAARLELRSPPLPRQRLRSGLPLLRPPPLLLLLPRLHNPERCLRRHNSSNRLPRPLPLRPKRAPLTFLLPFTTTANAQLAPPLLPPLHPRARARASSLLLPVLRRLLQLRLRPLLSSR